MKHNILIALLISFSCLCAVEVTSRPISEPSVSGIGWGAILVIEMEVIGLNQSEYDTKLYNGKFKMRISKINTKVLDKPIIAYPKVEGNEVFEIGKKYKVYGYETIHTIGAPPGWDKTKKDAPTYMNEKLIVIKSRFD